MNTGHSDLPIEFATLVDLLSWRAQHQPDQPAYTFLADGDAASVRLTYADLDRQARAIAAQLAAFGEPGDRALLLYPPGLDFVAAFFGCLYAGIIAVPAYPPHGARMERTLPRIRSIVTNAQPQIALTMEQIRSRIEPLLAHDPDFHALRWLATDTVAIEAAAQWQPPQMSGDSLAFLQYTSGSTAAPKGVMVSHGNLLHNERMIKQGFGHDEKTLVVGWLPLYHDMGLIGNVLQPLYIGTPCVLMSPVAFLQSPFRWLQAISHYRATTSGGPNFAYDLCVRKITPEQRATLDLSSWRVAFNGAEPIRHETLERFAETFAPCGFQRDAFYPCYGLAEATLFVTGGLSTLPLVLQTIDTTALEDNRIVVAGPSEPNTQTLAGSGRIWLDQRLEIVDPVTRRRCTADQVGEIWTAGPSMAHGYWHQPEETERTFRAHLADTGEGPFLRTGDLGFVRDGELFVTGRLKDLIIIRGRNHYPQDIELTVERSHPALRPGCGAAFSLNKDGEERLVVAQEVEREHRNTPIDELAAAIRKAVAETHELQVYAVVLLKPGGVPKTSSGKIQRSACRAAWLAERLEVLGSNIVEETVIEQTVIELSRDSLRAAEPAERESLLQAYLRSQVAHVLGVSADRVDLNQPTSSLGIDSLMAIELQHTIETQLDVSVSMVYFLEERTLTELATDLLGQLDAPTTRTEILVATDEQAEQPLSHGQRALWFLHQLAPHSSAYHIASAVRIGSAVDLPALQRSFQALIDRHGSLRTTFGARQGEPFQRVHQQMDLDFQVTDATAWSETELAAHLTEAAQRPFDLQQGPLLRIGVHVRGTNEHVLLLVVHHIVADLWSLAVLTHELGLLYPALQAGRAVELPTLTLQYTDYARWQNRLLTDLEGEQLAQYWQQQLAGAPTVLNLPTDRPRPPIQTYRGAVESFTLPPELTQQLKLVAQSQGTTLFTTLLAAFQVLLSRYTGQQDLLVGSPTAGRSRAEFANLVGYLVNPVVLRANLAGNPTFAAFLGQVRQTVLAAFAHQAYPFPTLVERLQPERDPSRSPLFQVMFVLQQAQRYTDTDVTALALGSSGAQLNVGGLQLESVALDQPVAQFDVTLMLADTAHGLAGSLQYNADLFDAPTMARMAEHFQTLLGGIIADIEQPLATLPLLPEAEREQLLATWNDTAVEYPRGLTMQQLFEAQAARTPDAVALRWSSDLLSYAELNDRANRLAHYLQALGVGPEVRVGVCLERRPDLIVALLAILKAGGAYVPLDPAYPQERVQFMLQDSEAAVLLTQQSLLERLPAKEAQIVRMDTDWPRIAEAAATNPRSAVGEDNLAYIIYTSGSTGVPKGVAIAHRSAVTMLHWAQNYFSAEEWAGVLAATSVCFDLSVFEIFVPLSWGGSIILADNALQLPSIPAASEVTLVNTVPSAIAELLRTGGLPASVRTVNLAGEPLPQTTSDQLYALGTVQHVYNLYGPSEDTTYSTHARAIPGEAPPIGRPLPNSQVYLLDRQGNPVPTGVPGELCIGGEGLARGYLNRPALTAEKFVPDPFSKIPGARLYKTGDLARYRRDGQLLFMGRIDHQVKVRGFRIELGEIETALRQHPQLRDALVLVREDQPSAGGHPDQRLVAYVVENKEQRIENKAEDSDCSMLSVLCSPQDLRSFLLTTLPAYMVPSAFVTLPALPLTPNGKVDRKALPAPDTSRPDLEGAFVAPRTPEEQLIAGIWSEVLGLERVGVYDNFFELGGHSLKATQVMARVQDQFQTELPLHTLFEEPTVARLAQIIGQNKDALSEPGSGKIQSLPRGDESLEHLLAEFEDMSAEDILAMLEAVDQPENIEP